MTKLLKANFYKLSKEKSTFILMAISAFTALFIIVIYYVAINLTTDMMLNKDLISGRALFISGIQLGQNVGILLSLGASFYIGKEFSQNTIRNKIAIGYSKTKIYLANLIMSVVISALLYLSYQLMVLCVGVPLFGWSANGFVFSEFIRQLINSVCILIAFSAMLNLFSMLSRNMVTGILANTLGTFLGILIFVAIQSLPISGETKIFVDILTKSNFLGQSLLIIYTNTIIFMIWCIASAVIITAGSAILGCFLFEKLDVK